MTLEADRKVQINFDNLTVGDIEDFEAITGRDFDEYRRELLRNEAKWRNASRWSEMMTLEIKALLWVLMRDDDTRSRVYNSDEELRRTMLQDLRALKLTDFEQFAIATDGERRQQQTQQLGSQGLDDMTRAILTQHGYDTPEKIAAATDAELRKIRGIGRVRLHQIRAAQKVGALV